jgi:hypothetical protein
MTAVRVSSVVRTRNRTVVPFTAIQVATLVATLLAGLGVSSTPAQASTSSAAAIVCNTKPLAQTPRGEPIKISVALGDTTATLTGVSQNRGAARDEDDLLLHGGSVIVQGSSAGQAFSLPTNHYYHPKATYLARVAAKGGGGFLCLLRSMAGQAPVAVLGVNPECMGACAHLWFVPVSGPRHSVQLGLRGGRFERSGDLVVLVAGDSRFDGEFTDLADGVEPIRVVAVDDGKVVSVTADHAARVRHDAQRAWGWFIHPPNGAHHGLGALAAWAADECTLGLQTTAFARLHQLAVDHRLKGLGGDDSGSSYVRHLEKFLAKSGYTRP